MTPMVVVPRFRRGFRRMARPTLLWWVGRPTSDRRWLTRLTLGTVAAGSSALQVMILVLYRGPLLLSWASQGSRLILWVLLPAARTTISGGLLPMVKFRAWNF